MLRIGWVAIRSAAAVNAVALSTPTYNVVARNAQRPKVRQGERKAPVLLETDYVVDTGQSLAVNACSAPYAAITVALEDTAPNGKPLA